jgi:hypothetical protein
VRAPSLRALLGSQIDSQALPMGCCAIKSAAACHAACVWAPCRDASIRSLLAAPFGGRATCKQTFFAHPQVKVKPTLLALAADALPEVLHEFPPLGLLSQEDQELLEDKVWGRANQR